MATSKPTTTTKPEAEQLPETAPAADEPAVEAAERPAGQTRRVPGAPSFGLCAGTVADLQQVEKTTDPFTGKPVTRADVK